MIYKVVHYWVYDGTPTQEDIVAAISAAETLNLSYQSLS